jgi:PAS domain S-box-containing protein
MEFLKSLFSEDFMPHGYCYLWNQKLVWLHVVSDLLIALAYFSIPITLLYFVRKRRGLPFHWMFLCFGLFIVACGSTHAMEVWTLWHATYWLSGAVKAVTAFVSVPTAILLVRLVPKALALPSFEDLAAVNRDLGHRTDELAQANIELAEANKALCQSEERYRLLFHSNPHPVWVYDSSTLAFLDVNHSAVERYGFSRQEFLSMTIKNIRPQQDMPALLENLAKTPTTPQMAGIWSHRKKDGTTIDAEIASHPLVVDGRECRLVVATDVTDRTRTEAALRLSEARFASAFENAAIGMALVALDGRWLKVNHALCEIVGYSNQELLAKTFQDITHPEDLEADLACVEQMLEGGIVTYQMEKRYFHKAGHIVWVLLSVSLAHGENGENLYFISQIQDVTERKHADELMRQQRNDLARSNVELSAANRELEAFSYSVSHDLRAPLRSIDGFSLALLDDCSDKLDEKGKQYLHRVRSATQRMGALIDDLLDLARVTRAEIQLQRVDLSSLSRSILSDLKQSQPERHCELSVQEGLEGVADRQLIRIALENLLGNAWKFTAKRPSAHIEVGQTHCDGALAYFVRDNGAGFDGSYAERLFRPFQRLHDNSDFPGTGVGLATVRRIIDRHGGRIWAAGAPECGATFYFTLLESMH